MGYLGPEALCRKAGYQKWIYSVNENTYLDYLILNLIGMVPGQTLSGKLAVESQSDT